MKIEIVKNPGDIVELLEECSLPVSDLKIDQSSYFFGGYDGEILNSCVGVELLDGVALLRSLAVLPSSQGKGSGSNLVMHIENFCKSKGVRSVYLLTTTASSFFALLGYIPISRDSVPDSIKGSTQYSSVCPASATIMYKKLADG